MSNPHSSAVLGSIDTLFRVGSVAGLADGPLLERFLARGGEMAELAFAALVERHGPMVFGVCRRILGDPHEAADAFQATFLVLARKASTLRHEESLAPWLYGVSRRVALQARRAAARRSAREVPGVESLPAPAPDRDREELLSVLEEEVVRLPEKLRAAVVLCDLGGIPHEMAARQLHCPVGTIESRLSRGRERLRVRLTRRGLAPSAGLLVGVLSAESVSAALAASTTRAALALAPGPGAIAGTVSMSLAGFARHGLGALLLSRPKLALLFVLAACAATTGVAPLVGQHPGIAPEGRPRLADRPPAVAGGSAARSPLDQLANDRIELTRRLLENQVLLFKAGIAGIDSVLSASQALFEAERDATATKPGRIAAIGAYLDRTRSFETQMNPERSPKHEIDRVRARILDAEFLLARETANSDPRTAIDALEGRIRGLERKLDALGPRLDRPGRDIGNPAPWPPVDPDTILRIRPRFECLVEKVHVKRGQSVKKGDPLVDLFSTELATAKGDFLSRTVEWERSKRLHELRAKLVKTGSISQQLWIDTQNEEEMGRNAAGLARDRLRLYGLDPAGIVAIAKEEGEQKARITLRSPIDGVVIELDAASEDLADHKTTLMLIARPRP